MQVLDRSQPLEAARGFTRPRSTLSLIDERRRKSRPWGSRPEKPEARNASGFGAQADYQVFPHVYKASEEYLLEHSRVLRQGALSGRTDVCGGTLIGPNRPQLWHPG